MWIAVLAGFALVAAGALYQWMGAARDARRFPPPGRAIEIGRRRLHVVVRGDGAPAVWFESAIAASSLSWSRVQPLAARFTTACAYDRAGLGWSDPPPAPLTLAHVVDDLQAAIVASRCATPCILVGHSFGAFVCLAFAATYPQEVRGLVLVDPPTDWIDPDQRQLYMLRGARQLSRIGAWLARLGVVRACLALLTGGVPAAPRYFVKVFGSATARTVERLVGEVRKLPADVHPLVQAAWSQPKSFSAMAEYLRVFEEAATSVRRFQMPGDIALAVISAGDQTADVIAAHQTLARTSSRGRYILAAKSTHWVPFDEPDVIVEAIRQLIDLTEC
ncbi:MAG TPA: alpha/beta hydrolase [Vicinamibacterales bacterium]|nr:alpha/beta hydrolase [Vicinamibacterales bacterium]